MIVERLRSPVCVRLTDRNLRYLNRKALKKYRGNVSALLRDLVDAAEKKDARARKRKR